MLNEGTGEDDLLEDALYTFSPKATRCASSKPRCARNHAPNVAISLISR